MATLKIYTGNQTPLTAVGKHQVRLLAFAHRYPGWHYYTEDKKTTNAINGLLRRGSIIINEHKQFKVNL